MPSLKMPICSFRAGQNFCVLDVLQNPAQVKCVFLMRNALLHRRMTLSHQKARLDHCTLKRGVVLDGRLCVWGWRWNLGEFGVVGRIGLTGADKG